MIVCEFTVHGNPCPDSKCNLDHTITHKSESERKVNTKKSTQYIMWNTKRGFGRAE